MLTDSQRQALRARLRQSRADDTAQEIPRRPAGLVRVALSFGQEQLWFVDRFAPGLATYNIPCVVRVRGPLDRAALGRSLDGLVARHEALRTRLVTTADGTPAQVIDPPGPVAVETVEAGEPALARELIHRRAMRPFDLATGPLLRCTLARLAAEEHLLVVVVHHAVFDGWSAGVLVRDLAALYASAVIGQPCGLPDLPVQFADYAIWERDRLQGGVLASLEGYWRQALDGLQTVQFPADRPRPVVDDFAGAIAERTTDPAILAGLREVSRQQGTTLFTTVLAALLALLHRYTGQDDLVAGTVSANRGRPELAPLIGFLVNTLPIRVDASGDPAFTTLLARVKEATVGAFAHQDLPFGKLVDTLAVPRDASRAPVFQIAFSYAERDDSPVRAANADFAHSDIVVGLPAAKFDLTFAIEARPHGLWAECCYKTALFDPATVQRLLAHYEVLLGGIVANPRARLSQLPLLTGAELRAELTDWNDTAAPVPARCVHELFQAQAAQTPAGIAAQYEDQQVTYAELNSRANQVARRLRDLGIGPQALVGVCLPAGLRRLAALLGIWKAGGGYVPLDPALPAGRLAFMTADTAATVILTDTASRDRARQAGSAAVIDLDAEWRQIRSLDDSDLHGTGVTPASIAYVIYTSGSTGQPKGVMVEHRHVANFLHGMTRHWKIGPHDAVLQFSALTFDVSVMDMFMPLTAGAKTVLAPAETLHSPPRLAALLTGARITFAALTPAVLGLLPDGDYPDLKILLAAGEELPSALARRWTRPGLRLVNGYGPTETTVLATCAEITPATPPPPPIGLPVWPNYQAYILDPHLNPVPAGVTGELHIGGASVARGYLNRPDLTRERFIPDPFRDAPGARLYKTGDLARRRPDGTIVYAGRTDDQVKIHGVRIEPAEIETALTSHPAIAQAVLTVTTSPTHDKELTAYLRPAPGATPVNPDQLRAHLARTLPPVMIPAHLITLDDFPLNPNGKIDKQALPPPRREIAADRTAPETPTETMLTDLFAALLGTGPVGATDSFFDLGGNSLTAMRLVNVISRKTGVDLGVSAIFLAPTPRRLAVAMEAADRARPQPGSVVRLTEGGAEPALFLIHAIGGTLSAYAPLSLELSDTFTVYGLQSPALSGHDVSNSLAGLVTDYTRRIRAVQPTGPYELAGWSMGGVVAFEIARQLERDGAPVRLLVLLDAPFAIPADYAADGAELAARFVADAVHGLGLDMTQAPDPAAVSPADQLAWLADKLADTADTAERATMGTQLSQLFSLFAAHTRMLAGYLPSPPGVRAPTLVVSAANSPNASAAGLWQSLLSGAPVSVLRVASDHYAFLRPPLVTDIGEAIRTWRGDRRQECADGS
jgi:amino acid adenylation domain-containing protein